jgi:ABC-type branched-subunit amino acid transport system substrate-binding protein
MRSKIVACVLVTALPVLVIGGCSSSKASNSSSPAAVAAEKIDYTKLGLWDDGPCDPAKPPLIIGLMTVFESPVISLKDQATALEASARAFNTRGGANGACIEVHTCDDKASLDQALACVRELDGAGVVATVNDQGTAGQAEVSAAMAQSGIPRVATNVTQYDWGDQNAYPLDASGTGVTFVMPQGLIDAGVTKIGMIRVDLAEAAALAGLLGDLYKDNGATFPYDVSVPSGTTDFSQFILGAENAGVGGVILPLGIQESIQVINAGQQLGTSLKISTGLGSWTFASGLGDFAKQLVFVESIPPATVDIPVYEALRQDLTASGDDALKPENLESPSMRSWIGLYALLRMIRDTHMTTFSRQGITQMLKQAKDVPMLGIFGNENWTPDTNTPGLWTRKGIDRWTTWRWDPTAKFKTHDGNFAQASEISFSHVMCGSAFGAPGPC